MFERHVRRVRRLNNERRQKLLTALRLKFDDRIAIEGADAGLHIVVWFCELSRSREAALVEAAHSLGVGVHTISALYDPTADADRPDQVGLVMGYSALDARQIERGVHLLAEAVDLVRSH